MAIVSTIPVLLGIISLIFDHCFAENVYYVTPSTGTLCPGEPCFTLSEYAKNASNYFNSNASLLFLSGDHYLDRNITFSNHTGLSLVGNSTFLPNIISSIICNAPVSISFENIVQAEVYALSFDSCGTDNRFAISAKSVELFQISQCLLQNSTAIGLYALQSDITIANCHFIGNRGGIRTDTSTVTLSGANYFVGNTFESGILLIFSNASFSGSNNFINNSVDQFGGTIFAYFSSLSISDNASFQSNRAYVAGGAVVLSDSIFSSYGNLNFTDNAAGWFGAAVYANKSTMMFSETTCFVSNKLLNLQLGGGGIVEFNNSTVTFGGRNTFTRNLAWIGGVFKLTATNLTLSGSNAFTYNQACVLGGVIHAYQSNVALRDRNSFIGNQVVAQFSTGGVLDGYDSTVTCLGQVLFQGNEAGVFGGAINMASGILILKGCTFVGNSAQGGGAINALITTVIFLDKINFTNNHATEFPAGGLYLTASSLSASGHSIFINNTGNLGGGLYGVLSTLEFNGEHIFMANSAHIQGGAMYMASSSISFIGSSIFIDNVAGSGGGAVHLLNSSITLRSNHTMHIANNSASEGGGVSLEYEAKIYFTSGAVLINQNNTADRGGAIYVFDFVNPADCLANRVNTLARNLCFYQITDYSQFLQSPSIYFVFDSNEAKDRGSALYGGYLGRCTLETGNPAIPRQNALDNFQNISLFNTEDFETHLSSDAYDICFCEDDKPNCSLTLPPIHAIRGQTFTVTAAAIDQTSSAIPADIRTIVPVDSGSNVLLRGRNFIQRTEAKCTNLNFTVYSPNLSDQLTLFAEGPCQDMGTSHHFL